MSKLTAFSTNDGHSTLLVAVVHMGRPSRSTGSRSSITAKPGETKTGSKEATHQSVLKISVRKRRHSVHTCR